MEEPRKEKTYNGIHKKLFLNEDEVNADLVKLTHRSANPNERMISLRPRLPRTKFFSGEDAFYLPLSPSPRSNLSLGVLKESREKLVNDVTEIDEAVFSLETEVMALMRKKNEFLAKFL